jgi:hypothetical protein
MWRPESDFDEKRNEREAHYFRLFAGALCVAAITMGLLNAMNIIHI